MALTKPQYPPSQVEGQRIQTMGSTVGPQIPRGSTDPNQLYLGSPGAQDKTNAQYAPAGYTWDPVEGKYVKTVESAPRALATSDKNQSRTDQLFGSLLGQQTGGGLATGGGAGSGSGTGTGSGGIPTIQPPSVYGLQGARPGAGAPGMSAPGGVGQIGQIDTSAAQRAAFGRAKDQVGQEGAGALAGLRSSLGARGMLGSGAEYRGTTGVITKGQGELGDVSRQQAIDASGLAERTATTNAANALTGRGQDLSSQQSGYAGQIAQRGQDIQAQIAQNNLLAENARVLAGQRQATLSGLMNSQGIY